MGNGDGFGFDERRQRGERGADLDSGAARNDPARLIQRRMRREIQRRSGGKAIPAGRVERVEETGGADMVMAQLDFLAFGISNLGAAQHPEFREVRKAVDDFFAENCANPNVTIDHEQDGRHWTGEIAFRMVNPQERRGRTGSGKSTTSVGNEKKNTTGHERGSENTVSGELGIGKEGGPSAKIGGEHKSTESRKNENEKTSERKDEEEQELDRQDYMAGIIADIHLECAWTYQDEGALDFALSVVSPGIGALASAKHASAQLDGTAANVGVVWYWQSTGLHHGD